jgi:hypothetical protein
MEHDDDHYSFIGALRWDIDLVLPGAGVVCIRSVEKDARSQTFWRWRLTGQVGSLPGQLQAAGARPGQP